MIWSKEQSPAIAAGRRWILSSENLHKTDSEARETIQ